MVTPYNVGERDDDDDNADDDDDDGCARVCIGCPYRRRQRRWRCDGDGVASKICADYIERGSRGAAACKRLIRRNARTLQRNITCMHVSQWCENIMLLHICIIFHVSREARALEHGTRGVHITQANRVLFILCG